MVDEYAQFLKKATEIYKENDPDGFKTLLLAVGANQGYAQMLSCFITDTEQFKILADKIIKDSRDKKIAQSVKRDINMRKVQEMSKGKGFFGITNLDLFDNCRYLFSMVFPSVSIIWDKLPPATKLSIFESTLKMPNKLYSEFIKIIVKYPALSDGICLIPFLYEIGRSVCLWWRGEIDETRVIQNIVKSVAITLSSGNGSIWGSFILSGFGPVGIFVGGLIGGIGAGFIVNMLVTNVTNKFFNLPSTQTLQDAYKYLGISHLASENDVRNAYIKRGMIDHPDKETGSDGASCKLLVHYKNICDDRGFNFKP